MQKLVVIGAGMASGRVLEHLFDAAPDAFDVTLFNAEPRGNYNRIMLSPVLSGEKTYEEIVTHDDAWYADNKVTTRFGEKVTGIDRERKVVIGENGELHGVAFVVAQTLRRMRRIAPTVAAPNSSAPYWLTLPDWTGWSAWPLSEATVPEALTAPSTMRWSMLR